MKNIYFISGVLVVLLVIVFIYFRSPQVKILGSVSQGGEYHATTTYSKLGTPLFNAQQVIMSNSGTLGSVDITGAVAGKMVFMDATSTTDLSSTTAWTAPASAAAMTHTLDIVLLRGLVVESVVGLQPTTTITFRKN